MNRFIESLTNICRENLLTAKWLIAPSLRVGHQWLESVARANQPVINVRVQTVKGMALDLAAPEMARKSLTLITATAGALLVDSIWHRLPEKATGYLSKLDRSPTLSQTVYGSINALRLAGLQTDELTLGNFEVSAKGRDLALLARDYLAQLRARNLVDYADVLNMAIARLRGDLFALPDGLLILAPEGAEVVGLEKELIRAIPTERLRSLPIDQPESPNVHKTDLGLLSCQLNSNAAPEPYKDGTVAIFHAIGEANEAREVLRRCLAQGQRLDQVEILHTDTATYVPLFYEIAKRLQTDHGVTATTDEHPGALEQGVPITFADGIPASYGRPGRALTAWLNWIRDDYPQSALIRMLHGGLLQVPGMAEAEFSFSGLGGLFRSIGIGFGRDRYSAKIDEQIAAATKQAQIARDTLDEDSTMRTQNSQSAERRARGLQLLRNLTGRLLDISQPPATTSSGILESATQFLNQFARRANEQDNYSQEVLLNQIEEMKRWTGLVGEQMSLDLPSWLSELPSQVRIHGSGPKPGCLHVAHALTGGHSGRPYTYIVGLDDSRFPGPTLQDPILLDTERKQLSEELPTAAGRLRNTLTQFARLLARLRGRVTLSFSCRDLADDRETFPSGTLLSLFRIISGNKVGDQTAFMQWLAPPASFAPDHPKKCLDEGEWWLWRLCGPEKVSNATELVLSRFPHLARGSHASKQRQSDEFTEFDGFVPAAGADLNPMQPTGPAVSASALETLGRCPLAYFFRYALNVRPVDELVPELDRWLDPLAFGSLLHEVFRRFMTELRSEGKLPDAKRDWKRLEQIVRQEISKYRDLYPPPTEGAYRDQCRQLDRAARIFLMDEQERCKTSLPTFMEASIGLPTNCGGTPLDDLEPVPLAMGDRKSIRVRGRIDRIDRIGDEKSTNFSIWDYKTGSCQRYGRKDPFRQGRLVQHVLYLVAVQDILRRKVDPKATVESFGYFFPGVRGWGQRVAWTPQELRDGQAIVRRLCETISNGAFLPTDEQDDCTFCDYQPVCGDIEVVTNHSRAKLDAMKFVELQSVRELRRE